MKKKVFFFGFAVLLMAAMFAVAGCDNGTTTPNTISGSEATLRYETVPFRPPVSANARAVGDTEDSPYNLIFSAYDADSYYYLFLVGHVNLVPLAYRQAVAYNGVTPITIGYSATNVTEESITQSVEQASENSFTFTETHGWEVGIEAGVSFIADAKVSAKLTGEYATEHMSGRSTSNTYETARTKSSEITDEITATIGENNESPGLYRYALFTTTDVYYVLKTDHAKTTVQNAYIALCGRPTTYWLLDYEPDMSGSFRKTASGALLEVPELVIADLPQPTDTDITPIPPEKAEVPWATYGGGSYETQAVLQLRCPTEGAVIYYTTDGSTPTTSSIRYGGTNASYITITEYTVLKAIAVADGMENSPIMTETYTITQQELQTVWNVERPNPGVRVKDNAPYHVYIDLRTEPGFKNFDLARLQAEGYKGIIVHGLFGADQVDDGDVHAYIIKGHTTNTNAAWVGRISDIPNNGWDTYNIGPAKIPIADFDTIFTFFFDASGSFDDDWDLGEFSADFTAVKE
jgi:hypothetical protein